MAESKDIRVKDVALPTGHRVEDGGVAIEPSEPSKAYASVMDGYKKDKGSVKAGPWKLANYRRPFEMDRKDWEEHVYAQVRKVAGSEGTKDFDKFLAQALAGKVASDLMSLELVDVVERVSGKSLYQWYLWDYGSGAFFPHGESEEIGGVCQHGVELEGGKEIYENLEGAYYSFEGEIRQFVEFSCEDDD